MAAPSSSIEAAIADPPPVTPTPVRGLTQAPMTAVAEGRSSTRTPLRPPGFDAAGDSLSSYMMRFLGHKVMPSRVVSLRKACRQVSGPATQPTVPVYQSGRSVYEHSSPSRNAQQPGFDNLPFLPQGPGALSGTSGVGSAVSAPPNLGVGNPPLWSNIWSVTPTNFVTIKLAKVEDFQSWRIQFAGLLIVHQVQGFVDKSVVSPSVYA